MGKNFEITALFIFGFLFFFPLGFFPNISGLKIEDIFVVLIIFLFVFYKKTDLHALVFCVLLLSIFLFNAIFSYNYEVLFRAVQCTLVIIFVSILKKEHEIEALCFGLIAGAFMSAIIYIYNVLLFFSLDGFFDSMYFVKDYFMYENENLFSVHVNSLMAIMMAGILLSCFFYNKFRRIYWLCFAIPMLFVIIVSLAKNTMLALFFVISMVAMSKFDCKSRITLFILFFLSIPFFLFVFFENLELIEVIASNRFSIYSSAFEVSINNFPFGTGLGTQVIELKKINGMDYPAHNAFLSIAIEFGLPVALFCVLVFFILFIKMSGLARLFFLSFILTGMFSNILYFYKYHFMMLSLCFFHNDFFSRKW